MIDPRRALEVFEASGVRFFCGVPDSLLKDFSTCLSATLPPSRHFVVHNEGAAIALVAGSYMATGEVGLVYMQNSGLGNAVNPLLSMVSPEVYEIPLLAMVGWRGRPGVADEPQHVHQGRVTEEVLAILGMDIAYLSADTADWESVLEHSVATAREARRPVALLIAEDTFASYRGNVEPEVEAELPTRAEVIRQVLDSAPNDSLVVATTGYTARELDLLRQWRGESSERDLLVVGSMGHAISFALSVALSRKDRLVICLDGDGSFAMHMGGAALVGRQRPANLVHILLNNGVHESVGGQPSVLVTTNAVGVALACGYSRAVRASEIEVLAETVGGIGIDSGPTFIDVPVTVGTFPDLPRPSGLKQRGDAFREALEG